MPLAGPGPLLWNGQVLPAVVQETSHLSLFFPDLKNLTLLRKNPSEDPPLSEGANHGAFWEV